MKRLLVFIFGAVLCSIDSYSQNLIPKIGGSLSAGSFSKDLQNEEVDSKNKAGVVIGVALEVPVNQYFSIQPELLFYQKGFKAASDLGSATLKAKVTLNYLELPVMFKYNIKSFYINAGPSIAYGIGGNYELKGSNSQGQTSSESGDIKFGKAPDSNTNGGDTAYYDNAFDFGLQVGCGVKIAKLFVVDARYGFGLGNLVDKDPENDVNDNKSHIRSFQITVGFPIKLGAK